jgi:hypothetical protein
MEYLMAFFLEWERIKILSILAIHEVPHISTKRNWKRKFGESVLA